jgi:hypothetical protein
MQLDFVDGLDGATTRTPGECLLVCVPKMVESNASQQDTVFGHDSFQLDGYFAYGDQWEAFKATLVDSGSSVIVKRYTGRETADQKACVPIALIWLL